MLQSSSNRLLVSLLLNGLSLYHAFQISVEQPMLQRSRTGMSDSSSSTAIFTCMDRRTFGSCTVGAAILAGENNLASAQVFLDPAMYGDQELRVAAVDSIRESVRRAILKQPSLAPSFYQLALLDGLSYDKATNEFGPDGVMLRKILSSDAQDTYTQNLQIACTTLVDASKMLQKKTAVTIADAIAIGGGEAIESIGGPPLPVQVGRTDAPRDAKYSPLPIDILSGTRPNSEVYTAFKRSGLTDREMTALLMTLLTIERVEKTRSTDDWKASSKTKFRERGKMGRMSEFKRLTAEDIARAEEEEFMDEYDEDDNEYTDNVKDVYIADSFGTREERFGARVGGGDSGVTEKTFNRYVKELDDISRKRRTAVGGDIADYGWIATLLLDPDSTTTVAWMNKYATSNINYLKDVTTAYNSLTQLGAAYTGGKYESLLKDKPRKTLNDDGLNLF